MRAGFRRCTQMQALLTWMADEGWFAVLEWSSPPRDPLDQSLFDPRPRPRAPGFDDFAGTRGIHPGHPELSSLYHALASPRVRHAGGYASLAQLDALENFIFALRDVTLPAQTDAYSLAVLAYEYRPALATPHRAHADLVFSRTGIARIGSKPLNYDAMARGFSNRPAVDDDRSFAVTAARYGLFLVRLVPRSEATLLGVDEKRDCERTFVVPERKLFANDLLFAGTLMFGERHCNERLRRLAVHPGIQLAPGLVPRAHRSCAKPSWSNLRWRARRRSSRRSPPP
jgi:hypothetical protein